MKLFRQIRDTTDASRRLDEVEKKTVDLAVRLERLEAEVAPFLKPPRTPHPRPG